MVAIAIIVLKLQHSHYEIPPHHAHRTAEWKFLIHIYFTAIFPYMFIMSLSWCSLLQRETVFKSFLLQKSFLWHQRSFLAISSHYRQYSSLTSSTRYCNTHINIRKSQKSSKEVWKHTQCVVTLKDITLLHSIHFFPYTCILYLFSHFFKLDT